MTTPETEPLPWDIATASPAVQAFYRRLRAEGNTVRFAEMLALRSPPRGKTDRELFEGVGTLDKQFSGNTAQIESVVAAARARGYEPNPNDVYMPSLAEDVGDPLAFVPATGGRNHIRRVCELRGVSCHGMVEVKGRPLEAPIEAGALAPDLANEMIDRQIAANPDLARVDRRDLAAEVQYQNGFRDDASFGQCTAPLATG